ncbi:sigma-70 family RNA polymerase sigma factor [Nocardioides sp. TRM66260-LWL]|uniref:sigma-70 family RNA polymerase sigma factor n=1 Tax=Nocardioides sp. TRM66260-LWL TaxID=2874478 RepID=UPI001CC3DB72|nr:sigma-70 family RNA polymerase sigma factor [Nocardioides sp. TRM66260-LWL]MBZ5733233.1 sigma-70 family RNA polymerase sigma factor [Nocardioides sp. TRM66260-LWL]
MRERTRSSRGRRPAPGTSRADATAVFDAFYRGARDRLLLQTFALTGDLPAARRAVRDTFVAAWHHWDKVGRLDDPESWARPQAWAHAQRRHAARPWHRERQVDDDARATLDALHELPGEQRKVLLLNHLAPVDLPDLAREIGIPQAQAETDLQAATASFALSRGVPSTDVRAHLELLEQAAAPVRWPRHTIVRRAGTTRRRVHVAAGVGVTVLALAAGGTLVADTDGAQPGLDRALTGVAERGPGRPSSPGAGTTRVPPIPASALLTAGGVGRVSGLGSGWQVTATRDGAGATALPCQRDRFADPSGADLVVRELRAGSRGGAARAYQLVEASASGTALRSAYGVASGWFAGCAEPRVQLLGTYDVSGVGDDARLFVLRDWQRGRTLSVGVARTGTLLTVTALTRDGTGSAPLGPPTSLLRRAVGGLCDLPAAGACGTGRVRPTARAPLPVGDDPALLTEVDLPPAGRVDEPWVGSEVTSVRQNTAATRCDATRFTGSVGGTRFRQAQTRTFLIPDADLPPEFGLTETVGLLSPGAAATLVDGVRARLASCPDRDLGTEVTRLASTGGGSTELAAWRVTTQISASRSVRYAMAIIRSGPRVAQVGLVSAKDADLTDAAFLALARRAQERLAQLGSR